jgi:nucleoside-diphosphate-sugar epimerase
VDGVTVDLGSGSLVSIRTIVEQLTRLIGDGANAEFGALPDRPLEPTRLAKTAETFARIGWKPEVPLQDGLERTVNWYRGELQRSPKIYKGMQA